MSGLQPLDIFVSIRRQLNLLATKELRGLGLGPRQASALRYLASHQSASLADVARAMGSHPPAITRMVDCLIDEGWVERNAHPTDRRRWALSLTNKASKRIRDIDAIHRTLSQRLIGRLPVGDRSAFCRSLEMISAALNSDLIENEERV